MKTFYKLETYPKYHLLHKIKLCILLLMIGICQTLYSQTISTYPTWTANNGTGFVTFNLENTNTFPITISEIGGPLNSIAISTAQFWIAPTPINSTPPTLGNLATNGWTALATQTFTPTIGNNTTPEPVLTSLNIVIPPMTTIGVGISVFESGCTTGRLRYYSIPTTTTSPVIFSNSGLNLITGSGIGYAATSCTQTPINNRGFVGYINFSAVPTTNCSIATFPISAQTNANTTSVCNSGNVSLGITTATIMPSATGISYQYQSAISANGPWINTGTAQPTIPYSLNVTSPTYFRCQVLCNATTVALTSDPIFVDVITPQILSTSNATICGPGYLNLAATSTPGTTIYWFSSNNPANPLGSGTSFVTPYISNSTIFYAGAFLGSPQNTPTCASTLTAVQANIHERPEVDLGVDISKCVANGELEFLNARNPSLNYLWDNGYNGQVRVIDQSGTYWVYVENAAGCGASDTINVILKDKPISTLGLDTTVCIGSVIELDAGNDGIQYMWSTGSNSNSIITRLAGTYTVAITGENGCITIDSIDIKQEGNLPKHDGIYVKNINANTFNFSLFNPSHVVSVAWDFGDGTPISYENSPTHIFSQTGNYIVRLVTNSKCGSIKDTTTVHVLSATGLENLDLDTSIKIYPNPISNNSFLTIESSYLIRNITLFALNGSMVKSKMDVQSKKHIMNINKLAAGMYYLQIETDKGIVKKKLDILN